MYKITISIYDHFHNFDSAASVTIDGTLTTARKKVSDYVKRHSLYDFGFTNSNKAVAYGRRNTLTHGWFSVEFQIDDLSAKPADQQINKANKTRPYRYEGTLSNVDYEAKARAKANAEANAAKHNEKLARKIYNKYPKQIRKALSGIHA